MKSLNELLVFLINSKSRIFSVRGIQSISGLSLFLILSLSLLFSATDSFAQEKNFIKDSKLFSIVKSEEHSPQKAAIYSTLIPGWGQAYNKKYWKVPIVWAGIGAVSYFIYSNNAAYNTYKDYYIYLSVNQDSTIDSGNALYPWTSGRLGDLYTLIDNSRKNRDLSFIILFAVWGLNVIDANVDGHFFNFDIDEDLSLNIAPAAWAIAPRRQAYGLNLVLNLY